jgi:hypothetical protein
MSDTSTKPQGGGFHLQLSDEEKSFLKDLVRLSISQELLPDEGITLPAAPTALLHEKLGAFVTLKLKGRLRGCIGHIIGDKLLTETIAQMAKESAFGDPRFPALSAEEFERLEIEISVLSPISDCENPEDIIIGRHGLIIRKGYKQGLLLPQVAVEWNWEREEFLDQTCNKAGLPQGCWRDQGTEIYWFEAEVF